MSAGLKRLVLCADDYAVSPGVSRAIRELAEAGRLNATSVMAPGPDLPSEAARLIEVAPERFQIGLHVTLTGGLKPLSPALPAYASLPFLMARASTGRLDASRVGAEIEAQFVGFEAAFGRPPAFVDGHQHVHLLPQVRTLVIDATRRRAPKAWLRQCSGPNGVGEGVKGRIVGALSSGLAREARAVGLAVNPAFSGVYDFARAGNFAAIFPKFLDGLPDGAVVMAHPGYVDDALKAVDPLHAPREIERAYFAGAAFPAALAAAGFTLA